MFRYVIRNTYTILIVANLYTFLKRMNSLELKCKSCPNHCQHDEHLQQASTKEASQPHDIQQHDNTGTPIQNTTEASFLENCSSITDNGQRLSSQIDDRGRLDDNMHQLYQWAYTTSDNALTLAERLESKNWVSR
jgi:hypothetical protein